MKNYQIILALVTIVTLTAIDNQAVENLPMYGWLFRGLVWLIVFVNIIVFYEGVRAYAVADE